MIAVHFDKDNDENLDMKQEDYDHFLQIVAEALVRAFPDDEQANYFVHILHDVVLKRTKGKPTLEMIHLQEDFEGCVSYFASQRNQNKSKP